MKANNRRFKTLIGASCVLILGIIYYFYGRMTINFLLDVLGVMLVWIVGGFLSLAFFSYLYMIFASKESCENLANKLNSQKLKDICQFNKARPYICVILMLLTIGVGILHYLHGNTVVAFLLKLAEPVCFWIIFVTIILGFVILAFLAILNDKTFEKLFGINKDASNENIEENDDNNNKVE